MSNNTLCASTHGITIRDANNLSKPPMSFLFVVRPDPDGIAVKSREFFTEAVFRSQQKVTEAKVRLEQAMDGYDDSNWTSGSVIARAEENLETAAVIHEHDIHKLDWETSNSWAKKISIHPRAMPRPWDTDKKAWLAIFRHRLDGPSQQ